MLVDAINETPKESRPKVRSPRLRAPTGGDSAADLQIFGTVAIARPHFGSCGVGVGVIQCGGLLWRVGDADV